MATPRKKAGTSPISFVPSERHHITIGRATVPATMSVYGKLIKNITMAPSEAGTSHPFGHEEDLQLALVYGYQSENRCISLSPPRQIYLPSPTGPADGCGWDPKEFVVWKNLPKHWTTLHVQSRSTTLSVALALTYIADQDSRYLADVMCLDWMKLTASQFIDPSWNLQTVWVKLHQGDFTFYQQVSLSNVIQKAYGTTLEATSLTATISVQTVAGWIPAEVNS